MRSAVAVRTDITRNLDLEPPAAGPSSQPQHLGFFDLTTSEGESEIDHPTAGQSLQPRHLGYFDLTELESDADNEMPGLSITNFRGSGKGKGKEIEIIDLVSD